MSKQSLVIDWDLQTATITNLPESTLRPSRVRFSILYGGQSIIEGENMNYVAKLFEVVLINLVSANDQAGNTVNLLTTALLIESSDETIATAVRNEDGTITATPTGKAGTAKISVKVDTDPNTPEFAQGDIDIEWLAGEAVTLELGVVKAPEPV